MSEKHCPTGKLPQLEATPDIEIITPDISLLKPLTSKDVKRGRKCQGAFEKWQRTRGKSSCGCQTAERRMSVRLVDLKGEDQEGDIREEDQHTTGKTFSVELTLDNPLALLELIWEKTVTLKVILEVMSAQVRNAMLARNLRLKRLYSTLRECIKRAICVLVMNETPLEKCTWEVFKDACLEDECFTTLLEDHRISRMTSAEQEEFIKLYEYYTKDLYAASPVTGTITTSSTTVPMQIAPIDVPESKNSLQRHEKTLQSIGESTKMNGPVAQVKEELDTRSGQAQLVETCGLLHATRAFLSCESEEHVDDEIPEDGRTSNNAIASHEDRLLSWIRRVCTSPIMNVVYTQQWMTGPYKFMPHGPLFRTVMSVWAYEISEMSLQDLFLYQRDIDPADRIYAARSKDIATTYYDIAQSINVLEKLLFFQYRTEDAVHQFLLRLYDILERKQPKINTMFVIGAPDSGKNYFFDCVIHAMLNFGQIGNFNQFTKFPLRDCVNRRVLLWNNPNAEPSSMETLKTLFRGDSCNVKIKYLTEAVITRTPIFVLSTHGAFSKDTTFRSGLYQEAWSRCEALKNLCRKPNPIALFYLLIKWGLMAVTSETMERLTTDELSFIDK